MEHTKQPLVSNKTNGEILYASCTCVAGTSACNHTAALMCAVDDMNRNKGAHGPPSSTSLPRKWGIPGKSKKEPTPVNALEVFKPKYGQTPKETHNTQTETEPIHPALGQVDISRVMGLRTDLEKNSKGNILFSQVWPSQPDVKQIDRLLNVQMQARPKED